MQPVGSIKPQNKFYINGKRQATKRLQSGKKKSPQIDFTTNTERKQKRAKMRFNSAALRNKKRAKNVLKCR